MSDEQQIINMTLTLASPEGRSIDYRGMIPISTEIDHPLHPRYRTELLKLAAQGIEDLAKVLTNKETTK